MIIDEQDLFNFVFFAEKLSEEKRLLIEADKSLSEAVEFYTQLKLNSERELASSIKKKLAEKIPAYKLNDVIELYALKSPVTQNQNGSRMAASTRELTPKTTTKTFVDTDKDYLIKVLNHGNETKVFVFSTKDEVVKNFDIYIQPQNLKYHFKDNSEPLVINHLIDPEKIQLKLN
jgi:hypothetical protein